MRYLIIHGPNLNLLGRREPEIYGRENLDEINTWIREHPEFDEDSLIFFQSNHEGDILDTLHTNYGKVDGAVINPGALAHTSYSLRDAISAVDYPVVEIHLTDISKRESFRKTSVIADVCLSQVSGQGKKGYLVALKTLKKRKKSKR